MAYQAPVLFPDFRNIHPSQRPDYVASRLVELADAGELYVTDIVNQGVEISDLAGSIILGHWVDTDGNHRQDGERIPELSSYRVTIQSLDGGPIVWKVGKRPERQQYSTGAGVAEGAVLMHDVTRKANGPRATVALHDAWLILRQAGEHCRRARSKRLQDAFWKYRELRPDEVEQEHKPRRGRKPAAQPEGFAQ